MDDVSELLGSAISFLGLAISLALAVLAINAYGSYRELEKQRERFEVELRDSAKRFELLSMSLAVLASFPPLLGRSSPTDEKDMSIQVFSATRLAKLCSQIALSSENDDRASLCADFESHLDEESFSPEVDGSLKEVKEVRILVRETLSHILESGMIDDVRIGYDEDYRHLIKSLKVKSNEFHD